MLNIFSSLISLTAQFYLGALVRWRRQEQTTCPPISNVLQCQKIVPNVSQCQNEENCAKRKLFIAVFGDNDWRNDYCPHLLTFVDSSQLLPTRSDALSAFMSCLGILFMSYTFQRHPPTAASWIRICKQPIVAKIASVYDFNKISAERGRISLVALHVET